MKQTVSSLRRLELPRNAAEWLEAIMNFLFFLCGILAVGCVVLISAYMVISGVPAIRQIGLFRFLFGTEWASTAADPQLRHSALPALQHLRHAGGDPHRRARGPADGGVPFQSRRAPACVPWWSRPLSCSRGIPSVVFGLLGMQVLVPAVAKTFGKASGACLLSAIVVLSIMILPSIVSVSVTALNAVPPEYEQGSLALGATDTETWFKISVPAAKSGIAAGIVLGIGRAIGEAMAVMMVAGNSPNMPTSLFKSVTLPDHGHRQGDELRQRPAETGAVQHRAGAVPLHHAHQCGAQHRPEREAAAMNNAEFSPSRRAWNRFFTAAVWVAAALVIVLVAGIIAMVLARGIPHISCGVPHHHGQRAERHRRHPARHPQHTVCHSADITHRIAAGRGRGGLSDRVRHQPPPH